MTRTNERGSAILELPMVIGFVLVPFLILVITIPTWIERQTAANDAASEAARALILSGGRPEVAGQMVSQIEAGYGLPAGSLRIVSGPQALVPGQEFTVTVEVQIPALMIPVLGGLAETTWTSSHNERYPDYAATPD